MPTSKSKNNIGITLGDPSGIGPEVIAKALSKKSIGQLARYTIIGDYHIFARYVTRIPENCTFLDIKGLPSRRCRMGQINSNSGSASLKYLDAAIGLLKNKTISCLVTGPVCKEAIALKLDHFKGHTEYLAEAFQCEEYGMFFVCPDYRVLLVTRHIPLEKVPSQITKDTVWKAIRLTDKALKKLFDIKQPRLAVCGLNPHAGEGGRIGKKEVKAIIPAIQKARKNKIRAYGPFAADTLFNKLNAQHYEAIIAMYHDQGLIALKTQQLNNLVNVTIGLPFIRTSPAHGTAFDIAGKNSADPASMCAAIKLAVQLGHQ